MEFRLCLIAAVTAGLSACAGAPTESAALQEERQPTVFADQNRDGKVTREEAEISPALARVFDQYDADGDDVLDRAEFAQLEGRGMGDEPAETASPLEPVTRPREEFARPLAGAY